ncbi:MAG: undecaprenyl-phosphate galactose phosphotransferase WbaP [Bacillota bacterium]
MPPVIQKSDFSAPVGGVELNLAEKSTGTSAAPAVPFPYYLQRAGEALCLGVLDLLALGLSFTVASAVRLEILPRLWPGLSAGLPEGFSAHYWWLAAVVTGMLAYEGLYTRRLSFWRECGAVCKALTLGILLILAIVSLGKLGGEISRATLMLAYTAAVFLVPSVRRLGKAALFRFNPWRRRVLILGAGKTGRVMAEALLNDRYRGYTVCGFLDDDLVKQRTGVSVNGTTLPVLGGFRESDRVMALTRAYDLIVAAPGMPAQELVGLVNRLHRRAPSVMVVPDLFGMPVVGAEADYLFQERALVFRVRNNLASPLNRFVKRTFDLAAGGVILVFIAPLLAALSAAVKLDSPGPVFFRHRRIGRGGKPFYCLKFRTMHLNNEAILRDYLAQNPAAAEEWRLYYKLKGYDPRVTRVGRLLRRFSLDELPQLFNVLKGEMSLAGPRPYLPRERGDIGYLADSIFIARPGMTGLWQVSGRNELTFEDRVRLEAWYVHNWSLWLDITLLLRTFSAVFARRGAY